MSETKEKYLMGKVKEINSNLSDKQNKTDNSLTTTDKTIVGAINSINSNLSHYPLDGSCVKVMFGYDNFNSTSYIRFHINDNDYYQLYFNSDGIYLGSKIGGLWYDIWSK